MFIVICIFIILNFYAFLGVETATNIMCQKKFEFRSEVENNPDQHVENIDFEHANSSSANINNVDHCPDNVANSSSLHDCMLDEIIEPKKRYKSNPNAWKKNINKACRLKGEAYETASHKKIPAKPMRRPTCNYNRKHNCCAKIPEEKRKMIFDNFHSTLYTSSGNSLLSTSLKKTRKGNLLVEHPEKGS